MRFTNHWLRRLCAIPVVGLAAISLGACNDSTTPSTPTTVAAVSGNNQSLVPSATVVTPLVVSVLDQNGSPMSGVSVTWALGSGSEGTLTATTATTDSNGQASTTYTAGVDAGTDVVVATVAGLTPVDFTITVAAAVGSTSP